MKKSRNIFWGLLFILGALALLVGKMGYLEGIGFWSILVSIALMGVLIDGILHKSYGMVLFPLAFLVIVNDEFLGLEEITPWPVLGAALLGTIGLHILFPGKKGKHMKLICDTTAVSTGEYANVEELLNGEEISLSNSFGETVKYLTGNEISSVNLANSFGSLDVYFNNVVLKNGVAEVNAQNSFGSITMYVPGSWRVVMNVNNFFGEASEKGPCNPQNDNTLYINGAVSFGNLEIRYL